MTALAKATGLGRESLYKALSHEGDPKFSTIYGVLKASGLRVDITPIAKQTSSHVKTRSRKVHKWLPRFPNQWKCLEAIASDVCRK